MMETTGGGAIVSACTPPVINAKAMMILKHE
jgi:hypothetical protein